MRTSTPAGSARRTPTSTSAAWPRHRSMRSKLGQGSTTDFLGVSFSATDGVGHVYGPRSHEIQDLLVRLDRTIGSAARAPRRQRRCGQLRARIERRSRRRPRSPNRSGAAASSSKAVTTALQNVLVPALGPGTHVLSSTYTNIYLDDAARKRLSKDKALREAAMKALLSGGRHRVRVLGTRISRRSAARASSDRIRRAAALSQFPAAAATSSSPPRRSG